MGDLLSAAGAEVSVIPVVQGDGMPKVELSQLPDMIPILALRNAVLFPGTVFPITIGREMSIRLIEDAEKNNMFIGAVPQNDLSVEDPRKDDLYPYGTVAKIIKTLDHQDFVRSQCHIQCTFNSMHDFIVTCCDSLREGSISVTPCGLSE